MNLNKDQNNLNFNDYLNEDMKNEYKNYDMENRGGKKTKGIKLWIILLIIFIIVIISGIALAATVIFTDTFKSDKTLFMQYASKNMMNMKEIFNPLIRDNQSEIDKYKEEVVIDIDFIQGIGTSEENSDNSINDLELSILSEIDKMNDYRYNNIKLKEKDNEVLVEYIKNSNNEYITMSNVLDGYAIFNDELKSMFGLNDISEAINSMEIYNANISNEKIMKIIANYYEIVNTNLSDDSFAKLENQKININNQEIICNGYTLSLTEEQINTLIIKIVEQLKVDENIEFKTEEQRNQFNEYIDEIISDYNESEFDNEKLIIFTIFEKDGQVISSSITNDEFSILFEMYEEEEKILDISLNNFELEETYNAIIKSTGDSINLEIPILENQKLILDYSRVKESDNVNQKFYIKYENGSESIKLNMEGTIEENTEIELKEISDDEIVEFDNETTMKVSSELMKILEGISEDDTNELIKVFELKEEEDLDFDIEEGEISEVEKTRFNAGFELLVGENIESETLMDYMKTLEIYVADYELISKQVLRLEIDEDNYDEEKYTTIYNIIEQNKQNTYNIELEYDEETGLVNGVLLTII